MIVVDYRQMGNSCDGWMDRWVEEIKIDDRWIHGWNDIYNDDDRYDR